MPYQPTRGYSRVEMPAPIDPMRSLGDLMSVAAGFQQYSANEENLKARREDRARQERERTVMETLRKGIGESLAPDGSWDRAKITAAYQQAGRPEEIPALMKTLDDLDTHRKATQQAKLDELGRLALAVRDQGNSLGALHYTAGYAITNKLAESSDVMPWLLDAVKDPTTIGPRMAQVIGMSKYADRLKPAERKLMEVSPGGTVIDESGRALFQAPFKPETPREHLVTVPGPNGQPVQRLATEEELRGGVRSYRAPEKPEKPEQTDDPSLPRGVVDWLYQLSQSPGMTWERAKEEVSRTFPRLRQDHPRVDAKKVDDTLRSLFRPRPGTYNDLLGAILSQDESPSTPPRIPTAPIGGTTPPPVAPASAATLPAPGRKAPAVGDIVTVRGQRVRITRIAPDGTAQGVPVP